MDKTAPATDYLDYKRKQKVWGTLSFSAAVGLVIGISALSSMTKHRMISFQETTAVRYAGLSSAQQSSPAWGEAVIPISNHKSKEKISKEAESYFAMIPEEVNYQAETGTGSTTSSRIDNIPSADYSSFYFKNDKTWEGNPSIGCGENYPNLDKTCDSTKVWTQGIAGPKTDLNFAYPLEEPSISSFFGWRKLYGRVHYGVDFVDKKGTPILASERGTVTNWSKTNSPSFGIVVELHHGDNFTTVYAHMSRMLVSPGDYVEKGDVLGYMGSTGNTSANHLHFEIRHKGIPYNPFLSYLDVPESFVKAAMKTTKI